MSLPHYPYIFILFPSLILTFPFLSSIHMHLPYPFHINYPTYSHNSPICLILTSLSYNPFHVHFTHYPYIILYTSTMLPYIWSWHPYPIVLFMFIRPLSIHIPTYFHHSSIYLILTCYLYLAFHSSCHVHFHSFISHSYIFLHTSTMLPYIRSWHAIPYLAPMVLVTFMFISSIFHPYAYIFPSSFHVHSYLFHP